MKKATLFLLATLSSIVFFGCAEVYEQEDIEVEDVDIEVDIEEDAESESAESVDDQEVKLAASYEDWAMPSGDDNYIMADSMRRDCVGVANGMTYGGDLLSSLIVDDDLRGRLDLSRCTKSYVMDLEKKLAGFTQRGYGSDFYAFSVCNLADGSDLVSGYLWPTGSDTSAESFSYDDGVLLLANGKDVVKIDDSVRLLNQTATGAEVFPCTGEFIKDTVHWTCFLGFDSGEDGPTGSLMGAWTISPDTGSILNYAEYSESF